MGAPTGRENRALGKALRSRGFMRVDSERHGPGWVSRAAGSEGMGRVIAGCGVMAARRAGKDQGPSPDRPVFNAGPPERRPREERRRAAQQVGTASRPPPPEFKVRPRA